MNDRQIMENILLTTKGACDLYLHGTIESPTAQVRDAFTSALNDTLCMQDTV
ncbi:MAG: spore coat protein, partial [Oscillospiraceae bacterium]|nr:spore coat protein [Oscillospiraceae bacterium]